MRGSPAAALGLAALCGAAAATGELTRRAGERAGLRAEAPWEEGEGGRDRGAEAAAAVAVSALGGTRGIYLDYLWYQSLALFTRDRDRLYALPLYYRPMAVLQPRFVEMWAGTGWMLAFNASAKFPDDPDAAWYWVDAGVSRLREGLARNADHPRRHKIDREIAWTCLLKASPYKDPVNGAAMRERALSAWREDPFAVAARHFLAAAGSAETPSGQRLMAALVHEMWAEALDDPAAERERLLAGVAAWDALGLRSEVAPGERDHRGRMLFLADAADARAGMEAASAREDRLAAHEAWWRACRLYAESYVRFPQPFLWRGPSDSFGEPPLCVNWPYPVMRLARLGAPQALWERLAQDVGALLCQRPDWVEEERQILTAQRSRAEAHRLRMRGEGVPCAGFADLSGADLLEMAKEGTAAGKPEAAAACLERVLLESADADFKREAQAMLDGLTK